MRCLAAAAIIVGVLGVGNAAQAANYVELEADPACSDTPTPTVTGGMTLNPATYEVTWGLTFAIGAGRRVTDARVYNGYSATCTCTAEVTFLEDLVIGGTGSGSGSYTLPDYQSVVDMFTTPHLVVLTTDDGAEGDVRVYFYRERDPKVPPPQTVPTLSQWGLVGLTTLLLVAGAAIVRRRGVASV